MVGMTAGVHRTETTYVWPETLLRPPGDVRLVYLDLNHWIYLAKAATGRADGAAYQDALTALRAAKASRRFAFPLSAAHLMEMAGIASPRQRFAVADVMEELSGFDTLVDRAVVMRLEIEAAVDAVATRRPQAYADVAVLGHGCLQAVGRRGGARIRRKTDNGDDIDVTEEERLKWPGGPAAFDKWQAEAELMLDRALLRGPTDEEVPQLQADGWDPTVAGRIADDRAKAEEEQAARLDAEPVWRRGRIRDVVACRYIAFDAMDMFNEALAARGLEIEDVWGDPDSARRFTDSMPSADVWVSLIAARHRNPQTQWVRNHIFDADALSVAVPYCDIVVPDKESRHLLEAAKVAARLNTVMPVNVVELAQLICSECGLVMESPPPGRATRRRWL
jgi:hypothetical protein